MTSTSAFSSEDDVTKKRLQVQVDSICTSEPGKLPTVYELDRCWRWISENGYKKVALQFPDELLVDSVPACHYLQSKFMTDVNIFILGDTSYGSCCIDEVAAEHYDADSVIHFGSACLSPVDRLPVLYIFCNQCVDIIHAVEQLQVLCSDCISHHIIMADTMYQHSVESLAEQLKAVGFSDVVTSTLRMPLPHHSADSAAVPMCGQDGDSSSSSAAAAVPESEGQTDFTVLCRSFALPSRHDLQDYTVLYIGEEGRVLTNLMMIMNKCRFISYSPETCTARRETLNVNRELMKRFYLIERAKDARIVGIVAGTLGVSRTRDIISHLKALVRNAGKKSYTFVVGKLNVAKLANFLEVDVFVLVACPLNTLIDSKEFLKPVVTPFEMEVACNQAREWTGSYIADFQQLLPGASEHVPVVTSALETPDVSLISNKLRILGPRSAEQGEGSEALMLRSDAMTLVTVGADTAGGFLSARSWQGLQRDLGQTKVEKVQDGRSGLAAGYHNEPH